MPKNPSYTLDDKIRALELLEASAAARDNGVPLWSQVSRQTGVSRYALGQWWERRERLRAEAEAAPAAAGGELVAFPGGDQEEGAEAPPAGTREAWLVDVRHARRGAEAKGAWTAVATLLRLEGDAQGYTSPAPVEVERDPLENASEDELDALIAGELERIPPARQRELGIEVG